MNWYDRLLRRKPKDVIPNPRDNKRRRQAVFETIQREVLFTLQFLVFALAILILAQVGAK